MIDRLCKTCLFYAMPNGMCFCGSSAFRNEYVRRDCSCSSWASHECEFCGGTLEVRQRDGIFWWHCYACHLETNND